MFSFRARWMFELLTGYALHCYKVILCKLSVVRTLEQWRSDRWRMIRRKLSFGSAAQQQHQLLLKRRQIIPVLTAMVMFTAGTLGLLAFRMVYMTLVPFVTSHRSDIRRHHHQFTEEATSCQCKNNVIKD
jgi:hypothetical protein